MKGKKPTVQQRNALKRKVKEDWVNYNYIKTEVVDISSDNGHLTKEGDKEKYYVFKHKERGDELRIRVKR